MIDLRGRTALITGGSRGIGRAAALLLARSGADVAITYHTRARDADATASEVRSLGRRALVVGGDLSDPEVGQRLASGVEYASTLVVNCVAPGPHSLSLQRSRAACHGRSVERQWGERALWVKA